MSQTTFVFKRLLRWWIPACLVYMLACEVQPGPKDTLSKNIPAMNWQDALAVVLFLSAVGIVGFGIAAVVEEVDSLAKTKETL